MLLGSLSASLDAVLGIHDATAAFADLEPGFVRQLDGKLDQVRNVIAAALTEFQGEIVSIDDPSQRES